MIVVHGSTSSPFVRKVMAFAHEKGIAVENRPGRFGNRSPEWLAISPFAKIPAIEDGDYHLCDSSAIVHYLEAKHPEPALIPADARLRGKTIWFEEFADTIIAGLLRPIFFNRIVAALVGMAGDLAEADRAEAEDVPPILDYLEGAIPANGFLVGDGLTLADIAVASPFANLEHAGVKIDAAKYPKITAFKSTMLARPNFAGSIAAERVLLGK